MTEETVILKQVGKIKPSETNLVKGKAFWGSLTREARLLHPLKKTMTFRKQNVRSPCRCTYGQSESDVVQLRCVASSKSGK